MLLAVRYVSGLGLGDLSANAFVCLGEGWRITRLGQLRVILGGT